MFADGDASFNSNLFVEKMTVLEGDASMNSKLVVAGDVSLNSKVTVADNLSVLGNLSAASFIQDGDFPVGGRLFITGMCH